MGRCIRAQRRGALGSCFNAATTHKKGSSQLRKLDYSERNGYVTGLITQITHDPGRGAPVMKVKFRNPYKNQRDESILVAPEGVYSGQFIYAGSKAKAAVGNVLPLGKMTEGELRGAGGCSFTVLGWGVWGCPWPTLLQPRLLSFAGFSNHSLERAALPHHTPFSLTRQHHPPPLPPTLLPQVRLCATWSASLATAGRSPSALAST